MWTIFRRSKRQKPENERLKQLEFDFDALQTKVQRMDLHLNKLSGRYHRRFGTGEEQPATTPATEVVGLSSKDQLRILAGLRAGRPAPHRGE